MHDIGRTVAEQEFLGETQESFEFETSPEFSFGEVASPLNEIQENELAGELLSVTNENELNYFLGNLIKKAAGAAGTFIKSPTGQALGGILKDAAKKALPVVGGAIGGYFGGPAGSDIGSKIASGAGSWLGLEVANEGMEMEVARNFVRLGAAATVKAAQAPANVAPLVAARQAVSEAVRKYPISPIQQAPGRTGRWYRRGRKIIIVGV